MKKIILFNVAFSVLLLLSSCKKAKEKVKKARKLVAQYQRDTMKILGESLRG